MITKTLLLSLLAWIGSHTAYNVAQVEAPRVELRTNEEIQDIYYGDCKRDTQSNILAVHSGGVVFFNKGIDVKKKNERALVVHELTHYLQFVHNDQMPKTHEEREKEAIAVENLWRKNHGLKEVERLILKEPECA